MKNKIIILISLFSAFISLKVLNNTVFIANTPYINQQFIASAINLPQKIKLVPGTMLAYLKNPFNSTNREKEIITNELANIPSQQLNLVFSPVSKGVSAAEDSQGHKYVKIEKGVEVEVRKITLSNGKTITIVIPKKQ